MLPRSIQYKVAWKYGLDSKQFRAKHLVMSRAAQRDGPGLPGNGSSGTAGVSPALTGDRPWTASSRPTLAA